MARPTTKRDAIVVVGAGQAGAWVARTLRAEGYEGRVVLVGDEADPPYDRPPLSKDVLAGKSDCARPSLLGREECESLGIEMLLEASVVALDPDGRRVVLVDGRHLEFSKLVLATGARPRRLRLAAEAGCELLYLRTLEDARRMRAAFAGGGRVAVIGGGWLGLEIASSARAAGLSVTVLESAPQLLPGRLAPKIAAAIRQIHQERSVSIILGARLIGFRRASAGLVLSRDDGPDIVADLVVAAVGADPETGLAEAAGIAVDNGILVDEHGLTSHPDIYAVGDVANRLCAWSGRRLRLESWQNAQNQAIAVARGLCGPMEPYGEVPTFWSEQHGHRLQLAGLVESGDEIVVRGSIAARSFVAFHLRGGRIAAAHALGRARDAAFARRMVAVGAEVDPAHLSNDDIPLKKLSKTSVAD